MYTVQRTLHTVRVNQRTLKLINDLLIQFRHKLLVGNYEFAFNIVRSTANNFINVNIELTLCYVRKYKLFKYQIYLNYVRDYLFKRVCA